MFSTKKLYAQMCHQSEMIHKLTDDERLNLQSHLRKMYKDVESVCESNGLTMMLGGGNMLGAVRHGGFIPWDDDLDLYMPRKDYDLFVKKYAKELPEYYKCYAPNSENGPLIGFCKIVDTRTKFITPGGNNKKEPGGIYLDIFPLENIIPGRFSNKIRRICTLGCIYIAGCVAQYKNNSRTYRMIMSGSAVAKFNYWLRRVVGFLFSIIKYETWLKWEDKIVQCKTETGWYVRPMASYSWQPLPVSYYMPPRKVKFDDIEAYIASDAIKILEAAYGNWQRIPPPEDRWEHFVIDLQFPKE